MSQRPSFVVSLLAAVLFVATASPAAAKIECRKVAPRVQGEWLVTPYCQLRSGDGPTLLAGAIISALKAREIDGVVRRPVAALDVGQNVRIEGGPLDGLIGQVLEMREKDRVLVLLRLLNQQTKVLVTSDALHPLRAQA